MNIVLIRLMIVLIRLIVKHIKVVRKIASQKVLPIRIQKNTILRLKKKQMTSSKSNTRHLVALVRKVPISIR
jgi:hypothetical protein